MFLDATRDNKIVADLKRTGVDVRPVSFGGGTKQNLIQNLITTVEQGALTLPDIDPIVHELEVSEFEETAAGNTKYHAPPGFKDDCVDALALAVRGLVTATGITSARVTFGEDSSGEAPSDDNENYDGGIVIGNVLVDPSSYETYGARR